MKKLSLRAYLMNELMKEGYLSLDKVHAIAAMLNKKESNAERRLRPSESPWAKQVWNEKRHIIGYKWIGDEVLRDREVVEIKPMPSVGVISQATMERLFN